MCESCQVLKPPFLSAPTRTPHPWEPGGDKCPLSSGMQVFGEVPFFSLAESRKTSPLLEGELKEHGSVTLPHLGEARIEVVCLSREVESF